MLHVLNTAGLTASNPGMPERKGLIGAADASTLFLDEFAELPPALQAHLLRVLDDGEYQRLGETRTRHADFRLVGATNRPDAMLKQDVAARFQLRVNVPGLEERREDIVLIARHLLDRIAQDDEVIRGKLYPKGATAARMTPALVSALTAYPYSTHVRELEGLLWEAIWRIRDGTLDVWPEFPTGETRSVVVPALEGIVGAEPEPPEPPSTSYTDPLSIPAEVIQACLDAHDGAQQPVWRELGLSSRHVLTRLIKRYDLRVRGRSRG